MKKMLWLTLLCFLTFLGCDAGGKNSPMLVENVPGHVTEIPQGFVPLEWINEWKCKNTVMHYAIANGKLQFLEQWGEIELEYDIRDKTVVVEYEGEMYIDQNILEHAVHFYDPQRVNVIPEGYVSLDLCEDKLGEAFDYDFWQILFCVYVDGVGEVYRTRLNDGSMIVEHCGDYYINWDILGPILEPYGITAEW